MNSLIETAKNILTEGNFSFNDKWAGNSKGQHSINRGKISVGELTLKNSKFLTLFNLSRKDFNFVTPRLAKPLKPGQGLFRYESYTSLAGDMSPLIMIDTNSKRAYFFRADESDEVLEYQPGMVPYNYIVIDPTALESWTIK